MAKQPQSRAQTGNPNVDLNESSVYGPEETAPAKADDIATEATLDRLEEITGGADDDPDIDDPNLHEGRFAEEVDSLTASSEEEVDALEVNLLQDDQIATTRNGSGRVIDEIAEERVAEYIEVGPRLTNEGAMLLEPGLDDTSATIRQHHPNSERARSESVVEGNFDEIQDETRSEPMTDKGTGA